MQTKDFDYYLPPELIAQHPINQRDQSRMMCIDKNTSALRHGQFRDILSELRRGDCLVINNSKVLPARLLGLTAADFCSKKVDPSPIELLLLNDLGGGVWECLSKPGKKARAGARLIFGGGKLEAEIINVRKDGNREARFTYEGACFMEVLDSLGEMPLPPYITEKLEDKSRYQTVYAKEPGSAAAPTAGLHFTPDLLNELEAHGVTVAPITLHVGLGTFRPVKAENIEEHHMHSERYSIPPESAGAIRRAKESGGRIIAAGTTCCRTLEAAANQLLCGEYNKSAISGSTDIFIYPGYKFKAIDGLLTNFHLPQSTLIMLVSALLGKERTLEAYARAVREKYRFFSFGDCMLIV